MNNFFSIIIPVYNSQKYFSNCLKSVLRQNYNDYEIIIIDDASKDKSRKIYKSYSKNSSKIKVIKNKRNLGVSVSRNKGIKKSNGKYIIFLDSDDVLLAGCLKKIHQHIESSNSNIIVLKHNELKNDYNDSITRDSEIKGFFKNSYSQKKIQPINLIKNFKLFNPLCYNFALNRDFILKNKIFFEDIRMHEDHLFVSRLLYCREKVTNPGITTHARRSTSLESLGRTIGFEVCVSCVKNIFFYKKDYKKNRLKRAEKKFFFENLKFFTKKFFLNLLICSNKDLLNLSIFIKKNYPSIQIYLSKVIKLKKNFDIENSNLKKWDIIKKYILKKIDKEFSLSKEQKVNIFCSSAYSKICIRLLNDNFSLKINKVFDNNNDFQNQNIEKIKIKSIKKYNNNKVVFLVCNPNNYDFKNIKKQLRKLKILNNKIVKFDILKYYQNLILKKNENNSLL
ncbi:glycosyltransferase family 2 protein [Pelagibacterales bacterium SAG-MED20]|nr:glycosyltransferase family 2 protein [Pelagibacterales bacterium SAG-MED20]